MPDGPTGHLLAVVGIGTPDHRDLGDDEALKLHADWRAGRRDGYEESVARLEARFTEHLRGRRFTDPDNQRLLDGIGVEHGKGNLLRFLHDPRISPFNYLAERELRPPIVARKISHYSKNDRGANAQAKLSTVFRTEERAERFEEMRAKKERDERANSMATAPEQTSLAQPPSPRRHHASPATRMLDKLAPLFERRSRPARDPPTGPPPPTS